MRKELFIVKDRDSKSFGWWIKDDSGFSYAFCETRWGARRLAKRIIKQRNNPRPPIKEFIGEIK